MKNSKSATKIFDNYDIKIRFDGSDYDTKSDHSRLIGQIKRVFLLMSDNKWRTLNELAEQTGDPHSSISAQLRNLRKTRFGEHTVNKKRTGNPNSGIWKYQLIVNNEACDDKEQHGVMG